MSDEEKEEKELSIRVVVLGAILSALLASANAYLGLFAGMTVSASIPAAVVSMALLRAVRGSILENNLVQTSASAGESAAAGAIFTLPALILLGAWAQFDFLLSAVLIALGGGIGVLFTIFLRRALVVESELPFPEGVATAEVLRAGHAAGDGGSSGGPSGMRTLSLGALFGGLAKLVESGFGWSRSVVEGAFSFGSGSFYWGLGVSPALAAVGHIVGFQVALVIFAGGLVNWVFVLPFVVEPDSSKTALELVWETWSTKTRYLGVGAMCVGGLAALFEVRASVLEAIRATVEALKRVDSQESRRPRTERDLPAKFVVSAVFFSVVPIFFVFEQLLGDVKIAGLLSVLVLVFGFLFSSVAAYMAGLVGSSHNPVSGVTIATILFSSLLLAYLGVQASGVVGAAGPAAAILVGSIVCTAAAIGGDNVQDLKAGYLLRATPAHQQVMQLVGVFSAALVLGPVLQLLLDGYGFGAPTDAHPDALRAPQATLMASVAEGVFGGSLPWPYFYGGALLGGCALAIDKWIQRAGGKVRVPVLAFSLGLYLPWELSVPVLMGGAIRARTKSTTCQQGGTLAAAGLITGEALVGILVALGVAVSGTADWAHVGVLEKSEVLGVLLFCAVLIWLRRASRPSN